MLCAYLEKQQLDGKKKKPWTKRWFVLDGNTLSYYENQKAKNCKGSYTLGKGKMSCDVEKLEFELRTDSYARVFKAKTAKSFREWVTALYRIMVVGVFGKPIVNLSDAPFLLDWYNHLTKYGLEVEGIFRVSGQHEAINDLRSRYNRGDRIHLDAADEVGSNSDGVHIVADLLKTWFRSLPIKLISAEVVETLAEHDSGDLQKTFTQLMMNEEVTPRIDAAVLRQLFEFLSGVAARSDVNKMTASNLAVCFTPTLCYLPMSKMESADRILKKLAQCLASAMTDPAAWLPISQEDMAKVGAGEQRNGCASPTAAAVAAGGGSNGSGAVETGGSSKDGHTAAAAGSERGAPAASATAHVREDSDLTKLVKSAKQVKLNASPLGPIADDEDQESKASSESSSKARPQMTPQSLEDAKAMRKKLKDAGWVSKKARDGRTFFFHRKERRSSWSADGLVACWIRVKSSTTGKPYYYHSITKESKWRLNKGDLTFEHIFAPQEEGK